MIDEKKRVTTNVSLSRKDQEALTWICKNTGLNKTEAVRRMIWKFRMDEKGRAILRDMVVASHNVHDENNENGAGTVADSSGSSSLEPYGNDTESKPNIQDILTKIGAKDEEELYTIAKARTY